MQDSAFRRHVQQTISFVESVSGPLPDWRSTAFWRDSSFRHAWQLGKQLKESEEAVAELDQEKSCVAFPVLIYAHPARLISLNWIQSHVAVQIPMSS